MQCDNHLWCDVAGIEYGRMAGGQSSVTKRDPSEIAASRKLYGFGRAFSSRRTASPPFWADPCETHACSAAGLSRQGLAETKEYFGNGGVQEGSLMDS